MKKIITLLLVLTMLFALCACGGAAPSAPAVTTETAEPAAAETEEPAAAEAVPEALEEAEAAVAEAVDEAVTEVVEELPATPEYEIAIEKLKTLVEGDLEDFVIGEDYVITIPSKWWAIDGDVLVEFDMEHTYAAISTVSIPGFEGYTTDDLVENDELRDAFLGGIMSELEDSKPEEYRDITINGVRVLAQKASYLLTGERFTSDFILFVDERGSVNSLTFLQSEKSKSDYTEHFETILNTLRPYVKDEGPEGMININDVPVLYLGKISGAPEGSLVRIANLFGDFEIGFALPYYREYFESDSETHFLINYDKTVSIERSGDHLLVIVYEYVDGEELDENLLATGDMISTYVVNVQSSEWEKIA